MAKRGGYPGGMMPGGMNNLMKQAQKMQKQMQEQQKLMEEEAKVLEAKEFQAAAGGGVVAVTVNGKKELTKVVIDPEAVDPDDVEMLQDMIMAAANEALRQVDAANQEMMNKYQNGLGAMGGLGNLGGLGGLGF